MDVTVVVPTRNRSALLAMTLRCVLGQQDVDLEVIVVDEASTTTHVCGGDLIQRQASQAAPAGLPAARNYGAAEARVSGCLLDDDDLRGLPSSE